MIKKLSVILVLIVLSNNYGQNMTQPPVAKIIPKTLSKHGHDRVDNYYWLNERENPEVIKYLEDENAWMKQQMAHTEGLQEKIYTEITGKIKQQDESVPYKENGYFYYSRYETGKEYPVYCRKKGSLDAAEEILLDVNEMAKGYSFINVAGLNVSPDNNILAYGVDTLSRRIYDIYFKDLRTGKILDYKITNCTGGSVWGNDSRTVFFTTKDNTLRAYRIHRFQIEDGKSDLVYEETDPTFTTYVFNTKSKKYIIIGSSQTLSNEYRFIDADNPRGEFTLFMPRKRDLEYSVDHFRNDFYIVTNHNAKNFRLMKTPVSKTGIENWTEVIPHRENVLLQGMEIFEKYLVLSEVDMGLIRMRIIEWNTQKEHYIDFGEETYSAYLSINPDFDTDVLRYVYTSLTTPGSTYDYNMSTMEKQLLKRTEIVGGYNPEDYVSKRLYATARDGKKVPVSLVYRKGLQLNGDNPLLLYGYGSYGASMFPGFSVANISLLDRGFVYAIAHIRGGQELGRGWYEDGKLLNKKNTFNDFIDCAEMLIKEKYTNQSKLFAYGGSAGGLLMGAIINMRPDLFKGVIAAVPFVDVVTTMLDESIPLTTGEYDEWGNPNEKVYYDYMLSYSPYDQVEKKAYPALLVTTGLHDSQVQYWEPAKWVAKLRFMKTDNNPLYLSTNMDAGHGGASGRFRYFKEIALRFAFMLDLLGMKE